MRRSRAAATGCRRPTFRVNPRATDPRPLVSPRTAFWITDILSDADARAYIFGRGSSLEFPFPVAVKTGTSQAYHDNWTIGYTRRVTVGVWVGNFDRRPLRNSSGVTGAAPIFQAVMLAAHKRQRATSTSRSAVPDPSLRARRDLRAVRRRREPLVSGATARVAARRSAKRCRAAGITCQTRGCWWCGRRSTANGRAATLRARPFARVRTGWR